ncbi:MAG: hypothetical protein HY303_06900 [Candidatus Wallbacteria bacterium]|nr:hypothetical protein [Candidatus Wallbacteria bacterium]
MTKAILHRKLSGFALLAATLIATASAATGEDASKRQSPERLLEVRALTLDAKLGGPVICVAWGRGEAGHSLTRKHPLSAEFRVEETPFDRVPEKGEPGYCEMTHRILYRQGDRDFIAGWIRYFGRPGPPEVCVSCLGGELTNVRWGFDLQKQRIWTAAHAEEMPCVPTRFRELEWHGLRFGIPLDLERVPRETALSAISARGATSVNPGSPADVVLLPDDIDFLHGRNREAEAWIRQGAKVLPERDFEGMLAQGTPGK